jgi:hypothetical protein
MKKQIKIETDKTDKTDRANFLPLLPRQKNIIEG